MIKSQNPVFDSTAFSANLRATGLPLVLGAGIFMEKEIWKDILEHEGFYFVSNTSRVKSMVFYCGFTMERIVAQNLCNGYYRVIITKNRKPKYFYVHRLVATAFVPNPYGYKVVNHKNGVKTDNRIENLEWVTPKQNIHHAFENNLMNIARGVRRGANKLSEEQVLEIRRDYSYWKNSIRKLGKKYGVGHNTIHDIISRNKWKHI